MDFIDDVLDDLIEEPEFIEEAGETEVKTLYDSSPELKALFDKVLNANAGFSHKHAVMNVIKSLNNTGLILDPEHAFATCASEQAGNEDDIKALSFNYYLLKHVFKKASRINDYCIGFMDNAIESISCSCKKEFRLLINSCKDEDINEFLTNLKSRINQAYNRDLGIKLISKVNQFARAVKPFSNELFNKVNTVSVMEYYKMSVFKDLLNNALSDLPHGVIPWSKNYMNHSKNLRSLQYYMPYTPLRKLVKKACFKQDDDLEELINDFVKENNMPKGVKGFFITGYLRRIYKPMIIHELSGMIKPSKEYDDCLNELLNRDIDLLISNRVKNLGLEVEKTKEDFMYKYYSKAIFFSEHVNKLLFLLPEEEREGIESFKKDVIDNNYIMIPNKVFNELRLTSQFNSIFESCTNFPLVSREEYSNCELIKKYINEDLFNKIAKETKIEFANALGKIEETYSPNELISKIKSYFIS